MHIRQALSTEAKFLTDLAITSESHWGFNQKFLDTFKEKYSITEEYIEANDVFILENSSSILGFFCLETHTHTLEYFYISSDSIREGYGKIMWSFLISYCKEKSINCFSFVTSPEAVNFYTKLGAEIVGSTKSSIDNREIPCLKYCL